MADTADLLGQALDFMANLPPQINVVVHELTQHGVTAEQLMPLTNMAEAILMEAGRLRTMTNAPEA